MAFWECGCIRVIWTEEGRIAAVRKSIGPQTAVLSRGTMVGDKYLCDLRTCVNVVIPEGVDRIEKDWFKNSNIQSVEISSSV